MKLNYETLSITKHRKPFIIREKLRNRSKIDNKYQILTVESTLKLNSNMTCANVECLPAHLCIGSYSYILCFEPGLGYANKQTEKIPKIQMKQNDTEIN